MYVCGCVYISDFWYITEWQVISTATTLYCIRHSKGLIRFPVIVIRKCFWICILKLISICLMKLGTEKMYVKSKFVMISVDGIGGVYKLSGPDYVACLSQWS